MFIIGILLEYGMKHLSAVEVQFLVDSWSLRSLRTLSFRFIDINNLYIIFAFSYNAKSFAIAFLFFIFSFFTFYYVKLDVRQSYFSALF